MSIAPTQRDVVLQAVARGWCHEANSAKEMDSDLAEAITAEVCAALAEQAAEQAEPVAWECKAGGLKPLTQSQYDRQSDAIKRHYSRVEAPAPTRKPLTESQVDDLIHSNHFDRSYKMHASDETCLRWYRLGLRDGERAHGIK